MGDPYTAPLQTDEHDVGEPVVAFDDLVGDAPNRPAHVIGAENLGLDMKNAPCGGRGIHIGTGHFDMISSVRASQDSFDGCRDPSRVDPGDERTGHVHSAHSPHNVTSSTWARSCEWTGRQHPASGGGAPRRRSVSSTPPVRASRLSSCWPSRRTAARIMPSMTSAAERAPTTTENSWGSYIGTCGEPVSTVEGSRLTVSNTDESLPENTCMSAMLRRALPDVPSALSNRKERKEPASPGLARYVPEIRVHSESLNRRRSASEGTASAGNEAAPADTSHCVAVPSAVSGVKASPGSPRSIASA